MRTAHRASTAVLLLVSLLPLASHGDGAVIEGNQDVDIQQPSQKAILEWDGRIERLTIGIKYTGPADEMVWIVPVPSRPEVKKTDVLEFEAMDSRMRYAGVLEALPEPRLLGTPGAEPLVFRERIGVYDVAVLAPGKAGGIPKWLHDNKFRLKKDVAALIADYESRGWYIVASRIHPKAMSRPVKAQLAEGTLHPLIVSFETDRCVYPMRTTPLAGGSFDVLLWVYAARHCVPEALEGSDWNVSLYGEPWHQYLIIPSRVYERDPPGVISISRALAEGKQTWCVTKLRRTYGPTSVVEDLCFTEADYASFLDPADEDQVGAVATQIAYSATGEPGNPQERVRRNSGLRPGNPIGAATCP